MTPLKTTAPLPASARYSSLAMLLHWMLGLVIVAVFVLGLTMVDLPFSPQRLKFYNWHKWAGVCILALSALRLLTRLVKRPPALPAHIANPMPAWQHRAHHGTHHLLYALFFVVPLVGWAYSSAAGFPIVLFGQLPLPDFVPVNADLAEILKPAHRFAAYGLALLVLLHVAAAMKHHLIDRDGLLQRMLPGGA